MGDALEQAKKGEREYSLVCSDFKVEMALHLTKQNNLLQTQIKPFPRISA
jgi:hypothetical protein